MSPKTLPPSISEIRSLFAGLDDTIYLNTATMGVGCSAGRAAYERAAEQWSRGRFDWMEAERAGEDARAVFAQIVGAEADEIALVPAVSTAAGIVAANLPPAKHDLFRPTPANHTPVSPQVDTSAST